MGTVTTAQGAAALTNFLVGGTASFGDASYATSQALGATNTPDKIINVVTAIADVSGVAATGVQIIQQFSANSSEAGALAGSLGTASIQLTVAANAASITKSTIQNGFGSVTASQFDSLSASLVAARALVAAPEVAIVLGALSAGLMAFSWSKQANNTTVSSAFSEIQGIVQSYYSKLSTSDQAAFSSGLTSSMQTVLSGGMMVPRIDASGQIVGYYADLPTSAIPQSDGSTLYTFSSGVTYQQGVKNTAGPLQGVLSTGENVWTIPDSNSNSPVTLGLLSDGSYSYNFKDSNANSVAEVYIEGSGSFALTNAATSSFVRDVGTNNQLTVSGSGAFIGIAGTGNSLTATGANISLAGNTWTGNVAGNNNVISAIDGATSVLVGVSGIGDIVNLGANSNSTVGFNGANGVTINAVGDNVIMGANNTGNTIVGGGNFVHVAGTGDNFSVSNAVVNLDTNTWTGNIAGNGNTINAEAGSNSVLVGISGANDIVNLIANSNSMVGFNGASGVTINAIGDNIHMGENNAGNNIVGGGNGITVAGTGNSFYASNNTISLATNTWTGNIAGNGNNISAQAGSSSVLVGISGSDNIISLVANSNSTVGLNGGDGSVINSVGNGIAVNSNNTSETIVGGGNYIGVSGNGNSLVGTNNAFSINSHADTNISGGNDNIQLATASYVGLLGGSGYSVSGEGATIATLGNTSFNLSGGNDSITLGGSGDYLGLLGGVGYVVSGVGATINTWANTGFSLSGGKDIVGVGAGSRLNFLDGQDYVVSATGVTITANASTSAAVSGSNNSIGMGADSGISVNGAANTVTTGIGSSIVVNGDQNAIYASNSVISLGSGMYGKTVNVFGSGNYINDQNNVNGDGATLIVHGDNNYTSATGISALFYGNNNRITGRGNISNGIAATSGFTPTSPINGGNFPTVPASDGSIIDPGVIVYPVPTPVVPTEPLCPDGIDPIILNLDGDSVQTASLAGSSTYFDMRNDGQKVQTGWGTAGEGYLVYDPNDPNNTTAVTQDRQMIGGFGALQSLAQQVDGEGHGSLTSSDALWNSLKVWVDTTGTGQFETGQLKSLDQLGITSLNLDGTQANRNNNGNQILTDSTFKRADGSTGDIAGVNLMYNPGATADKVDSQVRSLIAAMASYDVPAANSTLSTPVPQSPIVELAASLH